jgi:thioredoxin reductase (NADPH)
VNVAGSATEKSINNKELGSTELVIIGGGPAGLTAGIYTSRALIPTLLIEKSRIGGQAASTDWIENYPGFIDGIGGQELAEKMVQQAKRFGLETSYTDVIKLEKQNNEFLVYTSEGIVNSKTVIIATGAKPTFLGVKGEIEFQSRGVSYCATCDGAFFKDHVVAVVGGGDAAVEEAIFLTKFANKVYIIHRRDQLRATKVIQQRAQNNPKIEFVWNSVIEEVVGNTKVQALRLKDVTTNQHKEIKVDGVFVYIGTQANSDLVKDLLPLDARGYINADENMVTTVKGLFAVGDVRKKSLRQVATAVADGAVAAMEVEKYLAE